MRTEKARNAYWYNSKFPGENQVKYTNIWWTLMALENPQSLWAD